MSWSSITKFLLGSMLGIAILIGSSLLIGYLLLTRLAEPPPKPYFVNEETATGSSSETKPTSTPAAASDPDAAPLEAGAYKARVAYSGGLALRDNPSLDAERIGGIDYNQLIVVLGESPDKRWQRVRLESGETEGWIKAGNIEPVDPQTQN